MLIVELMIHRYEILEQDTTGNDKSNAGRLDTEVFVNCVQDKGVRWEVAIYTISGKDSLVHKYIL